jgi:phosphatidate cytidylyltransferase
METPPDNTPPTPQPAPQTEKKRWSGLGMRIIGVLPLIFIAVVCILSGGWLFYVFVMTAAIVMLKEWDSLTKNQSRILKFIGYPVIITPCASIVWLSTQTSEHIEKFGLKLVLTLVVIIAATDIGAYFTGKRFGKHKLAPVISPNKTWEGLSGGVFFAMVAAAIMIPYSMPVYSMFGVGISIALLAQTGDLFESWVKRKAGAKDSGFLIPGHGGLLDRFDGYLLTAPAFALMVYSVISA